MQIEFRFQGKHRMTVKVRQLSHEDSWAYKILFDMEIQLALTRHNLVVEKTDHHIKTKGQKMTHLILPYTKEWENDF